MRFLLSLFVGITLIYSCSNTTGMQKTEIVGDLKKEIPEKDTFYYDTLRGMYHGDFGGSDIRVILTYVSNKNAVGYNIHKGLQRNIAGKVRRNGDSIFMTLSEPGDHEFDGIFEFVFLGNDQNPKGKWTGIDPKFGSKKFRLTKFILEKSIEGEINSSNFAEYFAVAYDSIGNFSFNRDGLCIYEYYPLTDYEKRVEQMTQIKGNWILEGNLLTIQWQKNEVFKSGKSEFNLIKGEFDNYLSDASGYEIHSNYYWP